MCQGSVEDCRGLRGSVVVHNSCRLSLDNNGVEWNMPRKSSYLQNNSKLNTKSFFENSLKGSSKWGFFWIAILFLYIKSLHNSHL